MCTWASELVLSMSPPASAWICWPIQRILARRTASTPGIACRLNSAASTSVGSTASISRRKFGPSCRLHSRQLCPQRHAGRLTRRARLLVLVSNPVPARMLFALVSAAELLRRRCRSHSRRDHDQASYGLKDAVLGPPGADSA